MANVARPLSEVGRISDATIILRELRRNVKDTSRGRKKLATLGDEKMRKMCTTVSIQNANLQVRCLYNYGKDKILCWSLDYIGTFHYDSSH